MNRIIIILGFIISFNFGIAQIKPPTSVTDVFKTKFPDVVKVNWSKESKTEWEAEFVLNGKETSANFTSEGKWLETETEIAVSELPQAISNTLKEKYGTFSILSAAKVEKPETVTYYETKLKDKKSGTRKMEILF